MAGILVLAASTNRSGVALTNVCAKASMVIPVIASYLVYKEESPNWTAIVFVLLAMVMIFGNIGGGKKKYSFSDTLLPLSVFLVYGVCDFLLKVLKAQAGASGNQGNIMLFIFSTAAVACVCAYLLRGNFRKYPFSWKAIPGGIILGLFNSFCTAFILKALGQMDAVIFYPVYNVGVVFLSLLLGIFLFREKLRSVQIWGVVLAAAAIVMLLVF